MPLKKLNLNSAHGLGPGSLEVLRGMPITNLKLPHGRCMSDGLGPLVGLPLKRLQVAGLQPGLGIEPLRGMQLKHLSLAFTGRAGASDAVFEVLGGFPLSKLVICGGQSVTDAGFGALQGKKLKTLVLHKFSMVSDEGWGALVGMTKLSELAISHAPLLTGLKVFRGSPLTKVSLSHCGGITDSGLKPLREMPLVHLKVACCQNVTEVGVEKFRKGVDVEYFQWP